MSTKVANMTGPPKPDESTGKSERRSPRIFISIPIRISGKDVAGQTFREDAKTLVVNRHGAKIATTRQLTLGCELTVENPLLGRTANAKVVWLGDRHSPSGTFEATLEMAELQNLLGIDFPPDSWQDGPPMGLGGQRLDKATLPEPIKITHRSTTSVIPPKPAAPAAVSTPGATDSTETRQLPLQPASSASGSPRVRADDTAPVPQPRSSMRKPVEDTPPNPEAAAPSTSGRVPFGARTGRAVTSLAGGTQSAREPLVEAPEDRLAEPSHVRSATQTGLREADERITQLEAQVRASRDEMQALVSKFQELKRISDLELTNTQRSIGQASVQAVKAETREIREKVREELERGYAGLLEKGREQLQVEVSTALTDLRTEASARLASLTEEFFSKLSPEAQGLSKQIAKSVEQLFKSESDAYQEKLAELSASGLQGIQNEAGVVHQSLVQHADETIREVRAQLRAAGKELIDGSAKQIHVAMRAGLDSINSAVETTSEEYRKHLQEALQEFRERTALELQTHFQQVTEKTQSAQDLFDRQTRDLVDKALTEAKGDLRQSVSEASGAVEAHLAAASVKLTGWEEQAVTRLKRHFEKFDTDAQALAGELQKQTEEISRSVLEEARSEANQLLTDMQDRTERAANAFHDREMQVIRAKFYTAMDELIEGTGVKLRKVSEENLKLASEELREKQQQAVNQAEDLFRDRLAGILRGIMQVVVRAAAAKPGHPESKTEPTDKRR